MIRNLKKIKWGLFLVVACFLFPNSVNAKTVTCTSTSNYTVGKNVYEGINVSCNDGSSEIFAVTELNNGYVENGYTAIEGKTYFIDFVWTGTIDNNSDKIIVDGEDQTQWAMFCDYGCHLSTKQVNAKVVKTDTDDNTKNNNDTTDNNTDSNTSSNNDTSNNTTENKTDTNNNTKKSTTYYWVTFDVNGGKETIDKQSVEEGKTVTKPTNPTRTGYVFSGWYYNNSEYNFSTKITKNITLIAKWNEDTTGKTNISFVNLTGLKAPYEDEMLDTSLTITTFKPWTTDLFNVDIKWFKGKDINNINEEIYSAYKTKVEAGYYYKAIITLTPGSGYTLDSTKVSLNGKNTTYTKDGANLVLAEKVYGPIKKGESKEPLLVIEDYSDTVGGGDETKFGVYAKMIEHDIDADSVVLAPGCLKITNTRDFEISTEICPDGSTTNTNYSKMYAIQSIKPLATLTLKKSVPGNTYTTDIILTDTKGRTYTATYTLKAVSNKNVTVGKQGDSIIAEFLGETEKNWYLHVEDLKDTNTYLAAQNNLNLSELGNLITIENIKVTSEDGEKKNGTFTIKIKINDELKKYKNFTFVYVLGDENYEFAVSEDKVEGHIEGDYLVAKLPHLSTYAIIGNNEQANKNNNGLYIGIGCGVTLLVVISIASVIVIKNKKII